MKHLVWMVLAAVGLQAAGLEFDVASVKPSAVGQGREFGKGGGGRGGGRMVIQMGAATGGRFVAQGIPLRALILIAYGMQDYQLSGGPEWLMTDRFDIDARPEAGKVPTDMETREMLQALLAERFGLKVRREAKNGPTYALMLTKAGKLKSSADQTPVAETDGGFGQGPGALMALRTRPGGSGGFPPGGPGGGFAGPGGGGPGGGFAGGRGQAKGGQAGQTKDGETKGGPRGIPFEEMKRGATFQGPGMFRGKAITMAQLLRPVMAEVRKPVADRTGLKGLFDVELEWTPAQMAEMMASMPADRPLPPGMGDRPLLFKALQDQLGLKLENTTGQIEGLVIEKVDKLLEN